MVDLLRETQSNAIAHSTENTKSWIDYPLVDKILKVKQLQNVSESKKRAMIKALFTQQGYRGSAR